MLLEYFVMDEAEDLKDRQNLVNLRGGESPVQARQGRLHDVERALSGLVWLGRSCLQHEDLSAGQKGRLPLHSETFSVLSGVWI